MTHPIKIWTLMILLLKKGQGFLHNDKYNIIMGNDSLGFVLNT